MRVVPYRLAGKTQQLAFLHFRPAIRVDILMPKAPERRPSIDAVGLLSPRSILWIIAREAPARSAGSFSDQPRDSRSMRMRALIR